MLEDIVTPLMGVLLSAVAWVLIRQYSMNGCLKRIEAKMDGYITGHDKWGDEAKVDIQRRLETIENNLNKLTMKLI